MLCEICSLQHAQKVKPGQRRVQGGVTCIICLGWSSERSSLLKKQSERQNNGSIKLNSTENTYLWRERSELSWSKAECNQKHNFLKASPAADCLPAVECRRVAAAGPGRSPGPENQHSVGGQRWEGQDTELEESQCSPNQQGEHLWRWKKPNERKKKKNDMCNEGLVTHNVFLYIYDVADDGISVFMKRSKEIKVGMDSKSMQWDILDDKQNTWG